MIATAALIGALLGQPAPAQPDAPADAPEDCTANRWGVCGSVFDEVADAGDDGDGQAGGASAVVYMSAPDPSNDTTAGEASADRSGCERTGSEYRDPVTGTRRRSVGVSCTGGPSDPNAREQMDRLRRGLQGDR
jgi:hypothetical protein